MLETLTYLVTTTPVLAAFSAVLFYIWWRSQADENTIPGPKGLPFIGSMPEFLKSIRSGKMVEYTRNLHKIYGPVVAVKAGVLRMVFIGEGKFMADNFSKEEFAFRPIKPLPFLMELTHGTQRGIFFSNGDSHKEMRRLALLTFRDFGVGKKSLDEMIQSEATTLIQHLETLAETKDGVMSDLKITMQYSTANIIHHIIFGFREEYDNPKWKVLVQRLYDFFAVNPIAFPENFIPAVAWVPGLSDYITGNARHKFLSASRYVEDYIESQIEDHRATYCEGEIRDFIDMYIKYETEQKEFYTKENIFTMILDLFRAGSDTAATTLTWSMMHLVRQKGVQQQLQEEIDEVVGDGVFSRKDKDKLVKTRAFLNEIHRYVTIVQAATPKTVEKPIEVDGFTFLPDDLILGNIYTIHHDEGYWKDPYTFRIDRWIGSNGKLIKHEGHFYPFSVGKRACAGRQLATIEVMLILVEFLQKFTFEEAKGYDDMTDEIGEGFLRPPKDFHLKVVRRQ